MLMLLSANSSFFFFNDTATTEIYTLSLHDALPIWRMSRLRPEIAMFTVHIRHNEGRLGLRMEHLWQPHSHWGRSEEHTSELQSQSNLVCRLLLEKKKKKVKCNRRRPNLIRYDDVSQ